MQGTSNYSNFSTTYPDTAPSIYPLSMSNACLPLALSFPSTRLVQVSLAVLNDPPLATVSSGRSWAVLASLPTTEPGSRGRQAAPAPSSLPVLPFLGARHGKRDPSQNCSALQDGRISTHMERQSTSRPKQGETGVAIQIHQNSYYTERIWVCVYLVCETLCYLERSSLSEDRLLFLPQVWMSSCLLHPPLHAKSLLSWPTPCDSVDCSPLDSSVQRILGNNIGWVAMPSPYIQFFPSQIIHI